jgi:hypothetical protein
VQATNHTARPLPQFHAAAALYLDLSAQRLSELKQRRISAVAKDSETRRAHSKLIDEFASQYPIGARVCHSVYGFGQIVELGVLLGRVVSTIQFDGGGKKAVVGSASLTRL